MAFTSEESFFYTNMERKRMTIERQRADGTLKTHASRNPLLGEKTPRTTEFSKDWDFAVKERPANLVPKERWVYADHNLTMMSKFNSQKEVFAKQMGWENEFKNQVKKFQDEQAEETASKQTAALAMGSARSSARSTARSNTARSDVSGLTARSEQMSLDEPMDDIMNSSAMKYIAEHNPQVLAKLRAERAAKYVGQLAKPIYPPTYRSVGGRDVFRPGGRVKEMVLDPYGPKSKTKVRSVKTYSEPATPIDTPRLKQNLGHLMNQLEETNNELARQELKVALNSKAKGYEKPRGGGSGSGTTRSGSGTARSGAASARNSAR